MPKHIPAPDRRRAAPPVAAGPPAETGGQRQLTATAGGGAGHGRGQGPRDAGPPRHRRPGRKVRLRRTTAALTLLAIAGSLWISRAGGEDPRATVAAGTADHDTSPSPAGATPAASSAADSADEDGSPMASLPTPPGSVVEVGNGRFTVLSVPPRDNPTTAGRLVRYTVEIEGGLRADADELADTVQRVLLDSRSWQAADGIRFDNVTPQEAASGQHVDIRVSLASPKTTDRLCAPMRTLSQVSCWNGERSVLNLRRWILGADTWGGDLPGYRTYLVNHEVGHGLGHAHEGCPSPGRHAPVMMQQTLRLDGCTPWAWPKGDGV